MSVKLAAELLYALLNGIHGVSGYEIFCNKNNNYPAKTANAASLFCQKDGSFAKKP